MDPTKDTAKEHMDTKARPDILQKDSEKAEKKVQKDSIQKVRAKEKGPDSRGIATYADCLDIRRVDARILDSDSQEIATSVGSGVIKDSSVQKVKEKEENLD